MKAEIDHKSPDYQIRLIRALNEMHVEHDSKKAKDFFVEYFKRIGDKEQHDKSKTIKEVPVTIGWLCKLSLDGANLSPTHVDQIVSHLDTPQVEIEEDRQEEKKPDRRNPQEFLDNKASEFIGEVEGEIDLVSLGQVKTFDFFTYMKRNDMPGPFVHRVRDWLEKKLAQVESDGVEAYGGRKREYNTMHKLVSGMLEDCDKYQSFKRANRKPRAKKKIPPVVQVKNLNYQKECVEYGLKSAPPAGIIGATQVWVFNTKTRMLGVYHTESTNGFEVKGSTIQRFDPTTSIQKKVRKPELVLPNVLTAGKVQLRKILPDLTTTESALTGRINNDTIILRIL